MRWSKLDASQIVENILKEEKLDEDTNNKFINDEIKGKSSEDIINLLASLDTKEHGGLTAITGFYYQFLVTIEYLNELCEKKWDFVAIELHDDIVVGKDKKIRFIQVKTSERNIVEVTDSKIELYSRKKKTKDGRDFYINNSWVDKLISKAELFKKSDGYLTEFELVTSFEVARSKSVNVNTYRDNYNNNKTIDVKDDLYARLKKEVCDTDGNIYKYNEKTDEDLLDLLKRFNIKKRHNLCDIQDYEDSLCYKLGRNIFSEIGSENISISKQDLYILIGIICSKCNIDNENLTMIITRDKLKEITNDIFSSSLIKVGNTVSNYGTKKTLDKIFSSINNKYKTFSIYSKYELEINNYFDYLLHWVNRNGGVRSLINRYMTGKENSRYYQDLGIELRNEKLLKLFLLIMILSFANRKSLKFCDNESLLINIVPEKENKLVCFFGLENETLDTGIKRLQCILESNSVKEELALFNKANSVIFEGYTDDWLKKSKNMEFRAKVTPSIDGLDKEPSINEITYLTVIVPGNYLIQNHREYFSTGNIKKLMKFWHELKKGE